MKLHIKDSKTALIPIGIPGCGKSTVAQRWFEEHEIVGLDIWRERLLGGLSFPNSVNEPAARMMKAEIVEKCMAETTLWIDGTNINGQFRRELVNILKQYDYTIVYVVFEVSSDVKVCLDRVTKRFLLTGNYIPDAAVVKMHDAFSNIDRKQLELEADKVIAYNERQPMTIQRGLHVRAEDVVFVGDLHGMFPQFRHMMERYGVRFFDDGSLSQVASSPPTFVFVGDLVDRGTHNAELLRAVMQLCKAGRGYCVKGNHDDNMVRTMDGWRKSKQTLEAYEEIRSKWNDVLIKEARDWLESLPYVMKVFVGRKPFLVSHAGVSFTNVPRSEYFMLPDKHLRPSVLRGTKAGHMTADGKYQAIRMPWTISETRNVMTQVYGHHNFSFETDNPTVPHIVAYANGNAFIGLESHVEQKDSLGVGSYRYIAPYLEGF